MGDIVLSREAIKTMTTADLKTAMMKTFAVTAKYIELMADIWMELENRGEDLSDLRSGMTAYLPMVASKRVHPEAVIRFAGQQLLLQEIAMLPLDEQRSLTEGEKIQFVTMSATGVISTDFVDLSSLHVRHFRQVFNMGRIRTPKEQEQFLREQNKNRTTKRKERKIRSKKVVYDKNSDAIVCGGVKILVSDIMKALEGIERPGE